MIARRSTSLVAIVLFVVFFLFIFSSSPNSDSFGEDSEISTAAKYVPKFPTLNDLHLPTFQPPAHSPPEQQQDSSSGDSKWFSNLAWLNPFSSSITLDQDRSVLPPLPDRPYVFTFYEPKKGHTRDEDIADARLLHAWRRAWYAQGFRPVILSRAEAMANPLYQSLKHVELGPEMEADLFRWLAWGHMGDGLLADWRCFPMAKYDDATLSHLRRGPESDEITRFDKANSALLLGKKPAINTAIEKASKHIDKSTKYLAEFIPSELLQSERTNSLAFYDSATISERYPALTEKAIPSLPGRRNALADLINSHLQNTFMNSFPGGIVVLKPFAEHTTALVEPALRLAKALGKCPETVAPSSCPPNLPECRPCNAQKFTKISQPTTYNNNTQSFTIGILPHPYTLISLLNSSAEVTTRHIRRETTRDGWLKEVTGDQMNHELGGGPRVVLFKRVVADQPALGTSLWTTVESLSAEFGQALPTELLDDFEWELGFRIPRDSNVDAKNEGDAKESMQHANPSEKGVETEYTIIQQAREILKQKTNRVNIRAVAEAWNMADTEVWRFVKAYRARKVVERKNWEEEERKFLGARPKM
ncbi:uncharacterized protein APUU_40978A [Aspergillus puulaauensis]|uniref:Uncharacterized protein n=1 Tax=Aspergillus puulaauensis TaxID=1220207 RepID=A0A7R8AM24_9EURO|nr:uncharacterized protein APUU_40978A [Aspergillus puulaauensis]BCS24534.1 hypothetical protein APUU_40978A [Aspergillus puulaauensis]